LAVTGHHTREFSDAVNLRTTHIVLYTYTYIHCYCACFTQ